MGLRGRLTGRYLAHRVRAWDRALSSHPVPGLPIFGLWALWVGAGMLVCLYPGMVLGGLIGDLAGLPRGTLDGLGALAGLGVYLALFGPVALVSVRNLRADMRAANALFLGRRDRAEARRADAATALQEWEVAHA